MWVAVEWPNECRRKMKKSKSRSKSRKKKSGKEKKLPKEKKTRLFSLKKKGLRRGRGRGRLVQGEAQEERQKEVVEGQQLQAMTPAAAEGASARG